MPALIYCVFCLVVAFYLVYLIIFKFATEVNLTVVNYALLLYGALCCGQWVLKNILKTAVAKSNAVRAVSAKQNCILWFVRSTHGYLNLEKHV